MALDTQDKIYIHKELQTESAQLREYFGKEIQTESAQLREYFGKEIQAESAQLREYFGKEIQTALTDNNKSLRMEIAKDIKASEKRTNHRTDILIEKVREDIKVMNETLEARTRVVVREEMDIALKDIRDELRLGGIRFSIFQKEMAALRRDHEAHVNNHAIHC